MNHEGTVTLDLDAATYRAECSCGWHSADPWETQARRDLDEHTDSQYEADGHLVGCPRVICECPEPTR
jgi:hypothetical protein